MADRITLVSTKDTSGTASQAHAVVGTKIVEMSEVASRTKPLLNRRSTLGILAASHRNAQVYNKVMNMAVRAPMFCKKATITKTKTGEERKVQRLYRLSNSHQLQTYSSAGIHVVAEKTAELSSALRLEQELEDKRAPALLSQSKGFQLLLEQAIISYVQVRISPSPTDTPRLVVHR